MEGLCACRPPLHPVCPRAGMLLDFVSLPRGFHTVLPGVYSTQSIVCPCFELLHKWKYIIYTLLCGLFFCCFKTALLRYNSPTEQLTHLRSTSQWFLLYARSCAAITMLVLEHFITLKINSNYHSLSLQTKPALSNRSSIVCLLGQNK